MRGDWNPPLIQGPAPPVDPGLVRDLTGLVGPEKVSADPVARERAARDLWPKTLLWLREDRIPRPPDVIVRPGSVADVVAVVDYARPRGIPVVPHGCRSGVLGGSLHVKGGIALDLLGLDRILEIDRDSMELSVEAGVVGWPLEKNLEAEGLTLGHFPSSIGLSSVGGWLATRSAGQASSKYGKIEDLVLGMQVVLGTGEVLDLRRPASGPDLLELFLGSEGCLGVIPSCRLRLHRLPTSRVPAAYRFRSLDIGIEAMAEAFHLGLGPSVVRLYDPFDTWLALGRGAEKAPGPTIPPPIRADLLTARERGEPPPPPGSRRYLGWALAHPTLLGATASLFRSSLLVVIHEGDADQATAEAGAFAEVMARFGATSLGEGPGRRWLSRRYAVSYQLPEMFDADLWVDTFEVAISWSRLEALYRGVREAVRPHAFTMAHFSHGWPDGCSIYFTFAGTAPTPARGLRTYEATWRAALDEASRQGATISHHHGVGLHKRRWMEEEIGRGGMAALSAVKAVCDPAGILNPGKLLP